MAKEHWADKFVSREPSSHTYNAHNGNGEVIEKGFLTFKDAKEYVVTYFSAKAMQYDMLNIK